MKHSSLSIWFLSLSCLYITATRLSGQGSSGQSTFQNWDFESTTVQTPPPRQSSVVPFATAFPGWSGIVGGVPQSSALVNGFSLGGAFISLSGPKSLTPVIDGKYSALLIGTDSGPPMSASISQSGVVPAGTESIQMKVSSFINLTTPGFFSVTLGGSTIPMVPLSVSASYTLWGGNIGLFAGSMETLTITAPIPPTPNENNVTLDDISFSTQFVPEPGTLALWGLGGSLMAVLLRRRTKNEKL